MCLAQKVEKFKFLQGPFGENRRCGISNFCYV